MRPRFESHSLRMSKKRRRPCCVLVLASLALGFSWGCIVFLRDLGSERHGRDGTGDARFLEVPQIVWGLNNQKIALARAALTARYLNRTLVMPLLSSTLFHNSSHPAKAIAFDRVFSIDEFNSRCKDFVSISRRSDVPQEAVAVELIKGSGRRWSQARDLEHLEECKLHDDVLLRIVGKNPFLWPDHWLAHDYIKIFSCLVLNEAITGDVRLVQAALSSASSNISSQQPSYIAVHMRIELDWMIHCKNTEDRVLAKEGKRLSICTSKEQIIRRVKKIRGLNRPKLVYLAIANELLTDPELLQGWGDGDLVAFEKKKLGVMEIYSRHSYLVQAAMDYEICIAADVFVGNSFSTFSSLVVLERTLGAPSSCESSFAYNLEDDEGRASPWRANLSLGAPLTYESPIVSCSNVDGVSL